jgi:hypothetical protein
VTPRTLVSPLEMSDEEANRVRRARSAPENEAVVNRPFEFTPSVVHPQVIRGQVHPVIVPRH